MTSSPTIAVVGLGYVGLPLAVEFGKHYRTIGFDLSPAKIEAYRRHVDPTGEVASEEIRAASRLEPTNDAARLAEADFIVVAVPTPVDEAHQPDFGALLGASASVGRNLKPGAIVVFESTVYPGATEEICVPAIEKHSGQGMEARLLRRLLARAHQPGRSRTHADDGSPRSSPATRRRRSSGWPRSTAASSRRASTRPRASRWPRPPRSSRTRSATSTSRS